MDKFSSLSALFLYVLVRQYFIARREGRSIYAKSVLAMIPWSLFLILGNFFPFSKLLTLFILLLLIVAPVFYYLRNLYLVRQGKLPPDNKVNVESSRKFALEAVIVFIVLVIIKKII